MIEAVVAPTLHDALSALGKRVAACEERGEKNIVFCEDKLTLLAEKAVLAATGGTMQTEVSTFKRFLAGKGILSKQGSVMAVLSLLTAHEKELHCFRRGAAEAVYETLAQFAASRVDADALRKSAEEAEGILKLKLSDLALLLEWYNGFLKERGLLDENGYLALLPQKIAETEGNIFFFAFPSFTRQAAEGVRSAMLHAKNVTGIFAGGEYDVYTNEAVGVFRRIAEECGGCRISACESTLGKDASLLLSSLFSADAYRTSPAETQHIFLTKAEDETAELQAVCALIKREICERGRRYRDFAVLIPGEESFPTVSRVFASYRIPFFADRKRPCSEHPFAVFALSVLTAVYDGGLPESIDSVCANVYFGNGDVYRNYLMKYGGYRGAMNREIKTGDAVKEYDRDLLVSSRERLRAFLALFPREGKASVFAEGVRALYALAEGETVTERLAAATEGAEREFVTSQAWEEVLEEITRIAGEERLTAREFALLLQGGTSSLDLSMIPPMADAVFVGDATDARFDRVPVLFCVGLTDELPRVCRDTAVITDGDIRKLRGLSVEIEPAVAVVNARARESFALNLCSFSEDLYLSFPLRKGGEETRRGEAVRLVEQTFLPLPMPEIFPYECCERQPALLSLLRCRHAMDSGEEDDAKKFPAVYAALLASGEGETVERLLGGERKAVPRAAELYFRSKLSPTLLESYFACPYMGFASKALRLKEREERPVLDTDTGNFVHTVLQKAAEQFNSMEDEEACRSFAEETARELLRSARFLSLSDTKAGQYTAERLVEECGEVALAAYRQLARSAFRVKATESYAYLPSLGIGGRMDRVDEADGYIRVIDYKTGSIDDKTVSYYTGRKLQLQLYLLAASKEGRPAGAFYFPAQRTFDEEGAVKYRMKGFFSSEEEVLKRMDPGRTEGKSDFYEGGGRSEKGMPQEDFEAFLDYARLVSENAEAEMRKGNVSPSPYEEVCRYCKFAGMCGFTGEPRRERSISCKEVAELVRRREEGV